MKAEASKPDELHEVVKRLLSNKRIAIVGHVYTSGPGQELEKYLVDKCAEVVFIGHPFYYSPLEKSYYRISEEGRTIEKISRLPKRRKFGAINIGISSIFQLMVDFLSTLVYFITHRRSFDIFIGIDGLNALSGLWLRRLGLVKKVVFYVIDYVPSSRFRIGLLNRVYHWVDRYCVRNCNYVWNLSQAMEIERQKYGITRENSAPQIVVPIGTNFKTINRLPISQIDRYTLVVASSLMKKQGIQLVIEALPEVISHVPKTKLLIVGRGDYKPELQAMVRQYDLEKYVEFREIEHSEDLEAVLSHCAIGLAPYEPDDDNFARFTDVGKPKLYAACGLPIIMTRVASVSTEIENMNAGIIIGYSKDEILKALLLILSNDDIYQSKRENAIRFAEKYQWDNVFGSALYSVINGVDQSG